MKKPGAVFGFIGLLVLFSWCMTISVNGQGQYTFNLNGQPVYFEILALDGDAENPEPGDVLSMCDFYLVLGEPGTYNFEWLKKEPDKLKTVNTDGSKKVIAVRASSEWDNNDRTVRYDPLEEMTPEEIAGLRGIVLETWYPETDEQLKHIDPAHTVVAIEEDAYTSEERIFPLLPSSLQYLVIDVSSNMGIKSFENLACLDSLRFFHVACNLGDDKIDLNTLAKNKDLVYLSVPGEARGYEALKTFAQLQYLDLSYYKKLDTINFVTAMPHLETLKLKATAVQDLSPANNHPSLRRINADKSMMKSIKNVNLPKLEILRVMMTPLEGDEVIIFRQLNPSCKIFHRWNETIATALAGADCFKLVLDERRKEKPGYSIPKKIRR